MFKNKKSTDFAAQVESLSANKATSLTSPSVKDTNAGAKAPESFVAAAAEELSGYVMKFNAKDGYGFVKGSDGVDYFFRIENFDGKGELPAPGRYVVFTVSKKARQMGKAPKIAAMRFDETKTGEVEDPTADGDESRVRCPHCGKLMVPRMQYAFRDRFNRDGFPYSICPFCFKTYAESEELKQHREALEKQKQTPDPLVFCAKTLFQICAAAIIFVSVMTVLIKILPPLF